MGTRLQFSSSARALSTAAATSEAEAWRQVAKVSPGKISGYQEGSPGQTCGGGGTQRLPGLLRFVWGPLQMCSRLLPVGLRELDGYPGLNPDWPHAQPVPSPLSCPSGPRSEQHSSRWTLSPLTRTGFQWVVTSDRTTVRGTVSDRGQDSPSPPPWSPEQKRGDPHTCDGVLARHRTTAFRFEPLSPDTVTQWTVGIQPGLTEGTR